MKKNSTVAVDPKVNEKLERFCKAKGFSKKDFISLSLDYFMKYGINPKKDKSPADVLEKISRRIEDSIRIQKAQEKDFFVKTLMTLTEVNERQKITINKEANFFTNLLSAFQRFEEIEGKRYEVLEKGLGLYKNKE